MDGICITFYLFECKQFTVLGKMLRNSEISGCIVHALPFHVRYLIGCILHFSVMNKNGIQWRDLIPVCKFDITTVSTCLIVLLHYLYLFPAFAAISKLVKSSEKKKIF